MPEGKLYIPRPFKKKIDILFGKPMTNLDIILKKLKY